MIAEILLYKHTTEWNIESLFTDDFKNCVNNDYPLVVSSMSTTGDFNECYRDYFIKNKRRARPSDILKGNPDWLTSWPARLLKLNNQVINVTAECSGGMYAIYLASLLSQAQNRPVVVFCAENMLMNEFNMWRLNSLGALHQETGRSFDSTSQGFKMGVGAVAMLVKHPSVKHQLDPIAVAHTFKFYTNPELITNPGLVEDIIPHISGIDYNSIDLWNAHATGTPVGDKFEYELFNSLVKHDIPIIGYKGHIGHCISASATMEICEMLNDHAKKQLRGNNIVGPKIVDDSRIITNPVDFKFKRVLKTSFGFGGKSAICLIDLA